MTMSDFIPTLILKSFYISPNWRMYKQNKLFEDPICSSEWECKEMTLEVNLENSLEYSLLKSSGDKKRLTFRGNISNTEPEHLFTNMLNIALKEFDLLGVSDVKIQYPKYKLEGYDKDNDVFVTFGYNNRLNNTEHPQPLKNLKEQAFLYLKAIKEDKVTRLCSDGSYEPIDTIQIVKTENGSLVWTMNDILVFRLYLDVRCHKPVSENDFMSIGSFAFEFNNQPITFDFNDVVTKKSVHDQYVVRFEFKNPDYNTFPMSLHLTKEMLENVTGITEILSDTDSDNFPEEIINAAFVLINSNDKETLQEISIPMLKGWKF